jgi:hypothetical protein
VWNFFTFSAFWAHFVESAFALSGPGLASEDRSDVVVLRGVVV